MTDSPAITVIIPAFNEENSIGLVVHAIPREIASEIIVSDNGSIDQTAARARAAGATVLDQPQRGYGNACLKAMEYLARKTLEEQPSIIVFLDGDYSDFPEEMHKLLKPLLENGYDMVIGSRVLGQAETGALQPQQRFGNWLATKLIRLFFGYTFTDLGPFRAIKWDSLQALNMCDKNYGWTVEMQVKAAKSRMKCTEVAVSYRKRIGKSKVSGTIKGSVLAGVKILWTIFKSI
jgi:glycosyltransferase involved in cell wall biosynthesis